MGLMEAFLAANGGSAVLQPGQVVQFSYNPAGTITLNAGDEHTNVVTVVAEDDEGNEVSDDDDHKVTGQDVLPDDITIV